MRRGRDNTTVTAVIPAYNAERFISCALNSVLAQTCEIAEIIVVDDGSTDGTADIAAWFPRTRVIRRPNGGQAAARNTGIRAASGEWIAFLDHDDIWLPRKTEIQLACVTPDAGVIHANRFNPIYFGNLWHRQAHVTPSGAIVRKQALLEAGCFEESRGVQGVEDLNLWLKIALTKWRFVQSETGLFRWRQTGQNQSANDLKMSQAELVNIDMTGKHVGCQPEEIQRVKQANRIEYVFSLIFEKKWDEAAQLLQECTPGFAPRWLSLLRFLKANHLADEHIIRWLHSIDARYGSHMCSGECTLPEVVRRQCMESCRKPYFRP